MGSMDGRGQLGGGSSDSRGLGVVEYRMVGSRGC